MRTHYIRLLDQYVPSCLVSTYSYTKMSTKQLDRETSSPLLNLVTLARLTMRYRKERDFINVNFKRHIKMKVPSADGLGVIETPTTCFGDVEFRGGTRSSRAKVGFCGCQIST